MSGATSVEQDQLLPSSFNVRAQAEAYRAGGRAWAFAAGTLLGVEIAAGESLLKTVALTVIAVPGVLYSNERRVHLQEEAEMSSPNAGQQG